MSKSVTKPMTRRNQPKPERTRMSKWIDKRKVKDIVLYEKGKAPANTANDELVPYLSPEYLRGKAQPTLVSNQTNFVWVEDGDIILLWDGSNAGEFFKAKYGVLASTMTRLIFDKEANNTQYLFHYFKSIEPLLKAKTSGSGIPHVDKQILGNFDVRENTPAEQDHIAQILNTVDAAIEQTETLIAKYGRIRMGLMQDLLTGQLDKLPMLPFVPTGRRSIGHYVRQKARRPRHHRAAIPTGGQRAGRFPEPDRRDKHPVFPKARSNATNFEMATY